MQQRGRVVCAAISMATLVALTSCTDTTRTTVTVPTTPTGTAARTSAVKQPAAFTPVTGSVIAAPVPVRATDGKTHLAYELALTNMLGQEVTVNSVDVMGADRTLLSLAGDSLGYWMRVAGNPGAPTTKVGPGQSALIWIDVSIDSAAGSAVPGELTHTLSVSVANPSPPLLPPTLRESLAPTPVQDRKAVAIAPPLAGPNWLDGNSCCAMTDHRMAVNPLNGGLWVAERFAVDYVQLQPDARMLVGDPTKLSSYPYYGAAIHAVSDGPVVAVVDGLPDQVPGKNPTGLTLDQYGGNYIVQDIGGGNYAFYAHLKPGSVRVKVGEALTSGQTIAELGNSGNSSAPHLHFHVMSTPDPLLSDGLPFVLNGFRLVNRVASAADIDPLLAGQPAVLQPGFEPSQQASVGPLVLDVMTYGNS
ncbi:peptidase M23 [Mycolicibacterium anyangense]|uniref:Peptidase M23 n=1 Tax=Mycolicibacterium anyangense TaxID=1431246 RepID=A0A6N4WFV5_9MYCO|nr:M23 family metallopeptidase [Mycolicibacterium anyangense]BBZ78994.1 peptidase M23 [Mycolicibacterium anyangense]